LIDQRQDGRVPAPISSAVRRAERILEDELRQGCRDKLVRGGLLGFLRYWIVEVRRLRPPISLLARLERAALELAGYSELAPDQRQRRIETALGQLRALSIEQSDTRATRPSSQTAAEPAPSIELSVGKAPRSGGKRAAVPTLRYSLDTPLSSVKNIGPARAKALGRLGLRVYGDLVHHYPLRHEPYPPACKATELLFMQRASFEGEIRDVQVSQLNRGLRKITARLADSTGQVVATWLRGGFAGPKLAVGRRLAVSGSIVAFGRQVVFENPDWELVDGEPIHTRRLVPVYPLTSGLHPYWLRALIREAVGAAAPRTTDFLPGALRSELDLPELGWALEQLHFPDDASALDLARRRLAFDELFLMQLVVFRRRLRWQSNPGRSLSVPDEGIRVLLAAQPFTLTAAQARAISEINEDLKQSVPMSRLLQGDVGSGKTAVAAVALFVAIANGGQGVLMAPTEILAEQHYRTITAFYERAAEALTRTGLAIPRVELLTGSATRRQKESIYLALKEGSIDLLVGTQAVIQEGVEPRELLLSVVDEQHRFGVRQRVGIRVMGSNPHLLVMSATPIPRTLALTLHGDLSCSIIDELPPGRQKIKTHLLRPTERSLAYEHIRREVARGRQAFIICPLVEDSPKLEARAATEEYERLQSGELSGLRLALLHGRMRPQDKDDIMRRFRDREFDVLVSTSVVEVGVDIPNASVMLVEGAERFGLAQLHQFRGRVGRAEHASTCILLTDLEEGAAIERLQMLARCDNGLELAEFDLRQRGPGDFLGVRQSGLPELRIATLNDIGLIESARRSAERLLARDPDLSAPAHRELAERVSTFFEQVGEPN
jgi:ATP-dependent DNA helicase RecG